jgi:hypothetical protein
MGQSLMGTVMSGMAFGTGSAIAHRAVGAIAGSFGGSSEAAPESAESVNKSAAVNNNECNQFQQDMVSCLQRNPNDLSMCQMKVRRHRSFHDSSPEHVVTHPPTPRRWTR